MKTPPRKPSAKRTLPRSIKTCLRDVAEFAKIGRVDIDQYGIGAFNQILKAVGRLPEEYQPYNLRRDIR